MSGNSKYFLKFYEFSINKIKDYIKLIKFRPLLFSTIMKKYGQL